MTTEKNRLVSENESRARELAQLKSKMETMQKGLLSFASGFGQEE